MDDRLFRLIRSVLRRANPRWRSRWGELSGECLRPLSGRLLDRTSARHRGGEEIASLRNGPEQALCFVAGANSIFYGEKLLTTGNPDVAADRALLGRLGMTPQDAAD